MTLYELGNVRMVADHYNIREVYNFTDKTTPVVFISPFPNTDMETADGTNGMSAGLKHNFFGFIFFVGGGGCQFVKKIFIHVVLS